jgi:hypothetical protein
MPVVRALGGGTLMIEPAVYTRQMLTPDKWCGIDLLLKQQDYIVDVIPWPKAHFCNYNLNDFRARMWTALRKGQGKEQHLGHWICDSHGVNRNAMDSAWLKVDPVRVKPVVIARSGPGRSAQNVYHNPRFPWHAVWQKYRNVAVFVGTADEHKVFCATCGTIPHHPTENLLEAARVIAGCDLFIGNQSAPHAIAEAMKKRIILEVWPAGANCLIFREGVIHGWNEEIQLPEV